MDPITAVVTALALGATSALKDTAAQAIKDGYSVLKALIQEKYPKVSVTQLEERPESKSRRDVVVEDLEMTAAAHDPELLKHAKDLLYAIQQYAPDSGRAIGIDLENIKGASLRISGILATGTGVRVKGADLTGDIDIRHVEAGLRGPEFPKV